MKSDYVINQMHREDWPQIRSIYIDGIRTGNATFETDTPDWETWNAAHLPDYRLVFRKGTKILAWAALTSVSGRCVYAGVAEISLYVAKRYRKKGIGSILLKALLNSTEQGGIWTLQAGIFPENKASLALVRKNGFRKVGIRKRLAKMSYGPFSGIWRDVVLMERRSRITGIT